jgi:hypothetical protein
MDRGKVGAVSGAVKEVGETVGKSETRGRSVGEVAESCRKWRGI